jgi:hypothetical protein
MDIVIELASPLASLATADSPTVAELRQGVFDHLARWQRDHGFAIVPRLIVRAAERPRGPGFLDVTVLCGGRRCPYDRGLVVQLYEAIVGDAVPDHGDPVRHVRDWIRRVLRADGAPAAAGDRQTAVRLLAALIGEALAGSAQLLVDREAAREMLGRLQLAEPALADRLAGVDPALAASVLGELARAGIGVRDRQAAARWLVRGSEEGWSGPVLAEAMADVLRPGVIDMHVAPDALARLLRDGVESRPGACYTVDQLRPEIGEQLGLMCDGLFYELGVYVLHVRCVADAELDERRLRFRLGDRLLAVRRGLGADEVLVNELPDGLRRLGIAGRPWRNPASGQAAALAPAADRARLEAAGRTTWNWIEYAILALAAEVRRRAHHLLSVDDVDDALAMLHEIRPRLVEAVRARLSAVQLTRVLRQLLRDQVGIRNLRAILQLLLDFRFTTGFRTPTAGWGGVEPYVYVGNQSLHEEPYYTESDPYRARFDLSPLQLGTQPPPAWLESGRLHAEFVKCGLRAPVTHQIARGHSTVVCYLIDGRLERQLGALGPDGPPPAALDEARADALLAATADETEVAFGRQSPVIFVAGTPEVAFALADLVAGDFPELRIVHRQALDPTANLQPISRVTVDDDEEGPESRPGGGA